MIDLYTFTTANGWKVSILLEELGLPYNVHVVDILKDEQFAPSFLEISPNNKIPAIVDTEGPGGEPISVFPNFGQMGHFVRKAEKIPYAIERFTNESTRILRVMDTQLGKLGFLAGPQYSIADIASYAWVNVAQRLHFPDLSRWPHVQRWFDEIGARPAVVKGVSVPYPVRPSNPAPGGKETA